MAKVARNWRIAALILVAAATFYFFYLVRIVFIPFVVAAAIAFIVYPAVKWAELHGIGRTAAILLVYMLIISSGSVLLYYSLPRLTNELNNLALVLPQYIDGAQLVVKQVHGAAVPLSLGKIVAAGLQHAERMGYQALERFLNGFVTAAGSLFSIIFTPILAFYFISDWEKIRDEFLGLFPVSKRTDLARLAADIDNVLRGFIRGELLSSLIVGVVTGVVAALLGIKYAFVIGLINGVAELFPYYGPFLGAAPSIALALIQSPRTAIYLGLALLIIQQLESNLIAPRIVGTRVGLHPLLVVFALLAGGELLGIWGMLLAVPLAAAIKVTARFLFYQVID
ncbi:MAG: AI-2E family transporter [Candidatus Saccharibacteria bacterium]